MSLKHATHAVISETETETEDILSSEMATTTSTSTTTKKNQRRNGGASATNRSSRRKTKKGLSVSRVFSRAGVSPFDELDWDADRIAEITDDSGNTIFRQENVEVPSSWSILATKVVVSKYFYGEIGTDERESSVRQLVHRVSRTIADWGQGPGLLRHREGCRDVLP